MPSTKTNKKKIVHFTQQAYYDTLVAEGEITIGEGASAETFTYSPEDTIYVTPSAIYFTDVSVSSSDWIDQSSDPDTGYEFYTYKAVLDCPGVTPSSVVQIIFADAQVRSGDYCNPCEPGEDTVTIYSNNSSAIIIPSIVSGEPAIVGIKNGHNYSTTEQVVGTWIDGKPLYEKTIQKILPNETDDIANTDLTSLNIDKMISLDAYAITTSGFVLFNNANTQYYGKLSIVYRSELNSGSNAPCLSADISSTLAGQTAYITIQYTKTTDTAEVNE